MKHSLLAAFFASCFPTSMVCFNTAHLRFLVILPFLSYFFSFRGDVHHVPQWEFDKRKCPTHIHNFRSFSIIENIYGNV